MKNRSIILLCILMLACCACQAAKPGSTGPAPAVSPGSTGQHKPELLSLFAGTDYAADLLFADITLPQETAVYAMTAEYRPTFIKKLPAGASVTILAHTRWYHEQPDGTSYYLIKDHADADMWTGWIEKKDAAVTIKEAHPRFLLYSGFITISPDNQRIAVSADQEGHIVVADRSGTIRAQVAYADIRKIYKNAADGEILGWSDDSTWVWFDTFDPPVTVCFGRINAATGAWELLKNPPQYASNEIAINYTTGDVLYSDFPFQFDTYTAAQTMASKKAFHLYKANLLRQGCKKISTNYGTGFDVRKDPGGSLQYRIDEHEPYRTVDGF